MKEIKFFGRGGQGAVTGAQVLATAAFMQGYWAQTFPQFGAERRGAPVIAYVRMAQQQIPIRSKVYRPDVVVVMDFNLFKMTDPLTGIKSDGTLILNCEDDGAKQASKFSEKVGSLFVINAGEIAHRIYGKTSIPIVNIVLLGAYCAAEGDVHLESINQALSDYFAVEKIAANMKAAKLGFEKLRKIV